MLMVAPLSFSLYKIVYYSVISVTLGRSMPENVAKMAEVRSSAFFL